VIKRELLITDQIITRSDKKDNAGLFRL